MLGKCTVMEWNGINWVGIEKKYFCGDSYEL
jgi:hypothetical protein